MKSVEGGKVYDAVLMDIDWRQEKTGMDIAEQLYKMLPRAKIIYVTGYNDRFSQHVFLHRANLCGYLVKPVDPEILVKNLQKAEKLLSLENDGGLFLNINGSMVHVLFYEIIYIESRDHVVTIHTAVGAVSAYVPLRHILQYFGMADPSICVTGKMDGDYLFIKTVNPSKTLEPASAGHGYGSLILSDLSGRYGGGYYTAYKDGVFTANVSLLAAG